MKYFKLLSILAVIIGLSLLTSCHQLLTDLDFTKAKADQSEFEVTITFDYEAYLHNDLFIYRRVPFIDSESEAGAGNGKGKFIYEIKINRKTNTYQLTSANYIHTTGNKDINFSSRVTIENVNESYGNCIRLRAKPDTVTESTLDFIVDIKDLPGLLKDDMAAYTFLQYSQNNNIKSDHNVQAALSNPKLTIKDDWTTRTLSFANHPKVTGN